MEVSAMDVASFMSRLCELSADDIRRCAAGLRAGDDSAAGVVSRWRAELAIDRMAHQANRATAQSAVRAAHEVIRLVADVARKQGIELPDADVTLVARSAAQIARGLTLRPEEHPAIEDLLSRFQQALDGSAALQSDGSAALQSASV
jgi:hypothetical protein